MNVGSTLSAAYIFPHTEIDIIVISALWQEKLPVYQIMRPTRHGGAQLEHRTFATCQIQVWLTQEGVATIRPAAPRVGGGNQHRLPTCLYASELQQGAIWHRGQERNGVSFEGVGHGAIEINRVLSAIKVGENGK